MFVIRDYTWCVPSDASDLVHDISLYKHLVTTSGIAVALYSNADSEDFFNNFAKNASESWNVLTLTLDKAEEYVLGTSSYGVAYIGVIISIGDTSFKCKNCLKNQVAVEDMEFNVVDVTDLTFTSYD